VGPAALADAPAATAGAGTLAGLALGGAGVVAARSTGVAGQFAGNLGQSSALLQTPANVGTFCCGEMVVSSHFVLLAVVGKSGSKDALHLTACLLFNKSLFAVEYAIAQYPCGFPRKNG
jgi:hypothetical protein